MAMFYCKFNQVVITIATTVPDVTFLLKPVILVSGTWFAATDFADPRPCQLARVTGYADIHQAEKAAYFAVRAVENPLSTTV